MWLIKRRRDSSRERWEREKKRLGRIYGVLQLVGAVLLEFAELLRAAVAAAEAPEDGDVLVRGRGRDRPVGSPITEAEPPGNETGGGPAVDRRTVGGFAAPNEAPYTEAEPPPHVEPTPRVDPPPPPPAYMEAGAAGNIEGIIFMPIPMPIGMFIFMFIIGICILNMGICICIGI